MDLPVLKGVEVIGAPSLRKKCCSNHGRHIDIKGQDIYVISCRNGQKEIVAHVDSRLELIIVLPAILSFNQSVRYVTILTSLTNFVSGRCWLSRKVCLRWCVKFWTWRTKTTQIQKIRIRYGIHKSAKQY